MSTVALGIDFGVSTTEVVVADGRRLELARDEAGRTVFPSVVSFSPTGRAIIGVGAKERLPIDPSNTLHSVKRIMGEPWTAASVRRFVEQYPHFSLERHEDGVPRFATRQGPLTAEQVSGEIISHVCALAIRGLPSRPDFAVVGVPSAFSDRQRRATQRAVRKMGIEEVICVGEPLAAAWAAVREQRKPDRRIAVYDLGGGTFDLAVCEVRGGGVGLLASDGDEHLGGEDMDRLLAQWVVDQVLRRHQWDIRTSPESMARLVGECERVKIALSTEERSAVRLRAVEETDLLGDDEVEVDRGLIAELTTDLVRRTFAICDEVLARASVHVADIDEVYLVGGSTHIPSLRRAVARYFNREPIMPVAPEHLVALGAAHIAQATLGE